VRTLAECAQVAIRVDVTEPGVPYARLVSNEWTRVEDRRLPDFPPRALYEFEVVPHNSSDHVELAPGPVHIGWTRRVAREEFPEHSRRLRTPTSTCGSYAAQLLLQLAFPGTDTRAFTERESIAGDVDEPERTRRTIAYATADARRRWRETLNALAALELLTFQDADGLPAPIVVQVEDHRADTSAPLPDFVR